MSTTDDTNAARRGSESNDLLGQASEARWYCVDRDGVAMLCHGEEDARAQAVESDDCWPGRAPHRAVLLGEVSASGAHIPMARLIELETAEHERDILRADIKRLHTELRHARDGLTKGRTRMREDNERLRAVLRQALHALETESEWGGPTPKGAAAIASLREALGPNVPVRRPQGRCDAGN